MLKKQKKIEDFYTINTFEEFYSALFTHGLVFQDLNENISKEDILEEIYKASLTFDQLDYNQLQRLLMTCKGVNPVLLKKHNFCLDRIIDQILNKKLDAFVSGLKKNLEQIDSLCEYYQKEFLIFNEIKSFKKSKGFLFKIKQFFRIKK